MRFERRSRFALGFSALLTLFLHAALASAEEVSGKVKSVDVAAKKVVVTEKSTDRDREFTIDSSTSWTKEKKGKVAKKFDLSRLKIGSQVEVTSEGSTASKVFIKVAKKKGKAA